MRVFWTGFVLAMSHCVSTATAQGLADWTKTVNGDITTYEGDDAFSGVLLMSIPGGNATVTELLFDRFLDGTMLHGKCGDTGAAQEVPMRNGRVRSLTSTAEYACSLMVAELDGRVEVAMSVEPPRESMPIREETLALLDEAMRGNGARPPARPPEGAPVTAPKPKAIKPLNPITDEIEARMKAALADVPMFSRPTAIVPRMEAGASPAPGYWMVFANGRATDSTCYDWDPAERSPTSASLSGEPHACAIEEWQMSDEAYQFQGEDGTWSAPANYGALSPFEAGERLEVDLVSALGAESSSSDGELPMQSVTNGQLLMTKDGRIGAGDGMDGRSRPEPLTGYYYLDGHLIVIEDSAGRVVRGFIGKSTQDGVLSVYLNGTRYFQREG